ncbi:hypothetical protein V490_04119 [Pseudogymnoascus sp. VKM F-3557]|nr:hypothetical protein V490_04119 [Pseudogymnoascus sp. VKM F-3557]
MSVPIDLSGRLLFSSSGYCALCRETLPEPCYWANFIPPANDAWTYKIVGFYNIGNEETLPRVIAAVGDLANAVCFDDLTVNFRSGRSLALKVNTHQNSGRQGDRTAHLVHLMCWKLLKALDPNLTQKSIYEFAQSTYSLFNTTHVPEGRDVITTGFTGVIDENTSRSDFGEFLKRVSRLPLELQLDISEACPSDWLSSLLTVCHSTSTLVSVFKRGQGERHVELICHSDVRSLCAKFVSIFGNRYISSLEFNEPSESSEEVLVKASDITGFKFAIGRYGVKAIRICYASNEPSEWLGDPTAGWIGVMYGSDIRRLRILCDDLKCIRIDFLDDSPIKEQPRLLLDKDLSFRTGDRHRMLQTRTTPPIRNFPKWRMCRYLPFFDEKGYMSSLTMFCTAHSITGMAASGLSLRSVGEQSLNRVAMHMFFQRGERIVNIWLRMPKIESESWHRPNIMVLTNLNRTHVFGASLVPGDRYHGRYKWTLLNEDPRSIPAGFFFDALTREGSSRKIDNIAFGFSGDEQDARYVDEIFLGIDHKPRIEDLGPKFKSMMVFIVNEVNPPTVMWWFNLSYDYVMPWNGNYLPPKISREQRHITEFEI